MSSLLLLTACGSRITTSNWPGLSTDGEKVYVAFGPRVLAYDPATQAETWVYPSQSSTVHYFAAPTSESGRIIIGDYGRAGGLFSPKVTVSIYALESADSGAPRELWVNSDAATDKIVAPALEVGDQVFVGTADNHVLALEANSGSVQWDFETEHAIWGQPSYSDGKLFVASMDRSVYALDAATGDELWVTPLGGALPSRPVLGDNLLYVSSFDGNVHALNPDTGQTQWEAAAMDWVWGAPTLQDGTLYFSDIQGNLFAVDAATGEQLWTKATGFSVQTSPVVVGDILYSASGQSGETPSGALTAYSTADGRQLWSQTTSAPLLTTPVVIDDAIVVALQNVDVLLMGFDLATGQELWRYNVPELTN